MTSEKPASWDLSEGQRGFGYHLPAGAAFLCSTKMCA
jgi:hypothetical protein